MHFPPNTEKLSNDRGSALVIAVIVLVILGVLGVASLEIAQLNIFMSANDRDTKEALFHADSGVNIGHEYLEEAHYDINATSFYDSDASIWQNATNCTGTATAPVWGDCLDCTDPKFLTLYSEGNQATYVRAGLLETGLLEGSAAQIGAGYDGIGKSAAHGGTYSDFLIRSRRYGQRNSFAEIDLGWRHINR
jgi:Tfp pilus assembly protein PilX